MADWLRSGIERVASSAWERLGRTLAVVVGLAVMVAAFHAGHAGFASTVFVCGAALFGVGCLLEYAEHLEIGKGGVKWRTRTAGSRTADIATRGLVGPVIPAGADEIDASRWLVADEWIRSTLGAPSGPLEGCRCHLYFYDAEVARLTPIFEAQELDPPSEGWLVGAGAVGQAYATGDYVLASGSEVTAPEFNLTPAQLERYGDRHAVAAAPVVDAGGNVIAVLSASTADPASRLGTTDGQDELISMAVKVGRVLIDLLKWYDDPYDAGPDGGAASQRDA